MYNYMDFILYLAGSLLFGPCLAIWFSFYGDFWSLGKQFPIFDKIPSEWELVLTFFLFWLGFYCIQNFYSCVKHFLNRPPALHWWQTEVIYQIYVKSFFDSNGDGVGDLRGVHEKLDHVRSLGCKSIWLSPFYPSGGKDGGYDVSSFVEVDPSLGSLKDFDELVNEVHKRNMHVLLDLVPNHTSDQHEWFQESCKSDEPSNAYRDYYVWYPSKDKSKPPNNWKSVFGHSAWTYVESRQAWYLHQFLPQQPDLNLRSAAVRKELEKVFRFWLETKKVDGFRIDAVKHFFESKNFEDEPPVNTDLSIKDTYKDSITYEDLVHVHTANQQESYELLAEWRQICDEIGKKTGSSKALIVEGSYDVSENGSYLLYKNRSNSHLVLNFQMCSIGDQSKVDVNSNKIKKTFNPFYVRQLVRDYHKNLPKNCWANWTLGNHDQPRIASRIGRENINLANAFYLLVGGTAVTYYGEEIGMENLSKDLLKFEDCQDEAGKRHGPKKYLEFSRDFERTPMQWSAVKNAGFSKSDKTWVQVNPNYTEINVENQRTKADSHMRIYAKLVELREQPSFQWGVYKEVVVNEKIFSFFRRAFGFPVFLVVMNMSDTNENVKLLTNTDIAPRAYVKLYIPGQVSKSDDIDLVEKYKVDSAVLTKNVFLKARDILVLTWKSSD